MCGAQCSSGRPAVDSARWGAFRHLVGPISHVHIVVLWLINGFKPPISYDDHLRHNPNLRVIFFRFLALIHCQLDRFIANNPKYRRPTLETALITAEPIPEKLTTEGFFTYLITVEDLLGTS